MAIDFAGDMAVFFSSDDFGERVTIDGIAGEVVGIWDCPTGEIDLGGGRSIVDTNMLRLPRIDVADPAGRRLVTVRTGEVFRVTGEPRLNRDGSIWMCELAPDR